SPRRSVAAIDNEPKNVALPVRKTTALPCPLNTSVPINNKFSRSKSSGLARLSSTNFSEGIDSPVSAD
ncbi:ISPsy9, transposase OrfA, partial [Listeria innocua FSL S4-378]